MEGVESSPQLQPSLGRAPDGTASGSEQGPSMLKVCPVFFFTSRNGALLNDVSVRFNTFPLCEDITTTVSRTLPSSQTETLPIKQ